MAGTQVNLYEAKTQLSSLVERAAKGEVIVIAKAGKPMAKLIAIPEKKESGVFTRNFGRNMMGITFLSDDWEDDLPLDMFEGDDKEDLLLQKNGAR